MLKGKIAIITGGTRGIGFETARTFVRNGAKVIIFGSREETVNKALESLKAEGFDVAGYWPDLNNYDDIQKTIDQIVTDYGRVDILVNNAGISANLPIEQTTPEDFNKIIDLNVRAMFYATKAVVPTMKAQGSGVVLNTSSMVSLYGQPSGVGYPTSKFAVNGMTKSLARELAPSGIRVNAVAPGVTNTDMIAGLPEEQLQPVINTIPLRRIGEPQDIANGFLFLASDLASYVTGEILQVDGGARS